jgi:hypothetical protein
MVNTMVRQLWSLVVLVLLAGQACETRSPSGLPVTRVEHAGSVVMLRVRLGEGFQNNTVSVRVDGKEVFQRSGVSTDWTISRVDSVDVPTAAPTVQLDVEVENGPRVVQEITPAHTPFVEVRFVNGELQLLPFNQEPPMI